MPHKFVVEVSTYYPHRFTEEPLKVIYDKDGYIIGAVTSIQEGDITDVVDEYNRETEGD